MDRSKILSVLRKRKSRALHVAEICGRIGVAKAQRNEVHAALEALAEEGLVTQLPGARFRARVPPPQGEPPGPRAAAPSDGRRAGRRGRQALERIGRFTMNPRGFGFVATEEEGPDIFIPPPRIGGALHHDRVRVRAHPSPQGLEGQVVEVLDRRLSHVSGALRRAGRHTWIEPDDPRMRSPITVTGELPKDTHPGMYVIAEIVGYPDTLTDLVEAKVREAVDTARIATFEVLKTLLREGVVEEFPEPVAAEGRALPKTVPTREKHQREDLRHLDLLTIDPVDARDHDDAVWAERNDEGYRVVVAIADVSHYVREGSAMDEEALVRGCTIYLPNRAIPMLPAELSANLASLVPGKDRLALAVEVQLSAHGAVRRSRFIEGVVRSRANVTYEGVAGALGLSTQVDPQRAAQTHVALLQVLYDVSRKLRAKRIARGALTFELPEARVKLSEQGHPVEIYQSRRDPGVSQAYNLVEELMLLANEVVANEFLRRKLPTIYRVHPPPDEERVKLFAEVANAAGYRLDEDAGQSPKKLQRFLKRIAKSPQARALEYLMLRAMQQATYSTENLGHFGLAAKSYLHFTSPIRRYPDLAVHRLVRQLARKQRIETKGLQEKLQRQATESSRLERRAMTVERDVLDLYGALLMEAHLDDTFEATITGVAAHGIYATIEAPFVTVLCRVEELPDDRYELDEHGLRLNGWRTGRSFGLGDQLQVRISDVSLARRQVYALCAGAERVSRRAPGQEPGLEPPPRSPARGPRRPAGSAQESRRGRQTRKEASRGETRRPPGKGGAKGERGKGRSKVDRSEKGRAKRARGRGKRG